eukprot:m.40278 g.40278  ORF g.40278 m.40278 type:complete len:100 (-) comp12741_c0_seq4:113-412(-)
MLLLGRHPDFAILLTTTCRWCIPMMFPPVIMAQLNKIPLLKRSSRLSFFTELVVIGVTTMVFVPPALAVYPQYDSLPISKVEAKFQGDSAGRVYFNKGL